MKKDYIKYVICPKCKGNLEIQVEELDGDSVKSGVLLCSKCKEKYNIRNHIPRFVPEDNYARGFGLEWTKHKQTQYDSYTGVNISETRLFAQTKWPRRLDGEVILEVGSGSGRFTEQLVKTGAMIVSMDYSIAVDANYSSNGNNKNVLIVQADIYNMPFKENFFDRVLCVGMLQHTPRVEESFFKLPVHLKLGGSLAIDVYRKNGPVRRLLNTKHWVRPFTRKIKPDVLYVWCKRYVEFLWPLSRLLDKIPNFGHRLNWKLLIADYRGTFDLPEAVLKEWAILDTFDMISPSYDFPQTLQDVQKWFKNAEMVKIEVQYGYGGIEGRGVKP